MTNPERVHQFLKAHLRQGFCDDCVVKFTEVDRYEVNTIALTLALFPNEFTRAQETCSQGCSKHAKLVTKAK